MQSNSKATHAHRDAVMGITYGEVGALQSKMCLNSCCVCGIEEDSKAAKIKNQTKELDFFG